MSEWDDGYAQGVADYLAGTVPGQAFQPGALYDENLALRAHVKALEFEVASLIAQRDATRAWLGDTVVARSPLAEHTNPTTVEEKARQLAQQYPEQKIMAIKDLRAWSHHPDRGNMTSLGLKEAKDAMDRAYAELDRTGNAPRPGRPGVTHRTGSQP